VEFAETRKVGDEEIKLQLGRICASGTFRSAPRLQSLLQFLVNAYLDGHLPDEHEIGEEVFGRKSDWNTLNDAIVRTNMTNLRRRLKDYIEGEGREDSVAIYFPPRQGYEPRFEYAVSSTVFQHFRRGMVLLRDEAPDRVRASLKVFDTALALHEGFARAHAAKAEALLALAMWDWGTNPINVLPEATLASERALLLDPELWYGYATLATVHLFRRDWDIAAELFEAALERDQLETEDYSWYPAHLLARGAEREALGIVKRRAERLRFDAMAWAKYGLYLYLTRQFEEAESTLKHAVMLDERCWLGLYVLGLLYSSVIPNDAEEALLQIKRLREVLGYEISPGLTELCYRHIQMFDQSVILPDGPFSNHSRNTYVKAREWALRSNDGRPSQLEHALDECDPFMIWCELWPIFDKCKNRGRYRDVKRRMKLRFDPSDLTRD
jgi:tetratricopeptide (TPR) repeat protein